MVGQRAQGATTVPTARAALRRLLGVAAVVVLGGCALFDPHPRVDELTASFATGTDGITFAGGLGEAIDAALAQREAYADAASQYSIVRNVTAVGLAGASASALYLGLVDASVSNVIAGLGVGAAGVFGLGQYLDSPPRQRLYFGASQAIGCAILAARPYMVETGEFDDLTEDLEALLAALGRLGSEIARFEHDNPTLSADEPRTVLARGERAYARGTAYRAAVQTAGLMLRNEVLNIVDRVDIEITRTEPSLDALIPILANQQALAASFTSLQGVGTTSPASTNGPQTGTPRPVSPLEQAAADVAAAATRVAARINNGAAAADLVTSVAGCQVPSADSDFAVVPGTSPVTVAEDSTYRFAVLGSGGAPRASVVGVNTQGLETDVVYEDGQFVVVLTVTGKPNFLDAKLVIQSPTGSRRHEVELGHTGADPLAQANPPDDNGDEPDPRAGPPNGDDVDSSALRIDVARSTLIAEWGKVRPLPAEIRQALLANGASAPLVAEEVAALETSFPDEIGAFKEALSACRRSLSLSDEPLFDTEFAQKVAIQGEACPQPE